jgi:predicted DNA-binding transcriptional regulator YafY
VAVASARAHARTAAQVAAVVTAVRSGDRAAAEQPRRGPASTPADVVTLLRAAIEGREQVLIGYLDNHGTATQRRVRPERVEGGRLTAYDERSDDVRDFAIHRITTAAPVGR